MVNGEEIPKVFDILDSVDWAYLAKGVPSNFHGDLHFENILMNSEVEKTGQPFTLLDWRQDYAGILEYGDIYYDFSKLNHGFIMSHELVAKNLFNVSHSSISTNYDLLRKHNLVECENYFKEYIIEKGFDYTKIEMLTAIIFLNIAPLHHFPYSSLLFYHGKVKLHEYVFKYNKGIRL